MKIETDSFFQDRINSILLTTSWVEKVKASLGIEAVSQVWGNHPAWYLWLSQALGTYQLQLADPAPNDDRREGVRGIFSVKCYPYTNNDVFRTFSQAERRVINSDYIDDTHTPRFDDREKIPEDLFNVAIIDYAVDREDTWACLTLESLSTLRVVNDQLKTNEKHHHLDGNRRTPDRCAPGWQLGRPLFDRLLSMVAFYSRTSPARIRVTRASGFDVTISGSTPVVFEAAPDINCYTASVLFNSGKKDQQNNGLTGTRLMEQAIDTEQPEVLFDEIFPAHRSPALDQSVLSGISDVFPINRQWWSLATADHRSELASTCGCDGGSRHQCLHAGQHTFHG